MHMLLNLSSEIINKTLSIYFLDFNSMLVCLIFNLFNKLSEKGFQ
jgi:hypothetical protein